MIPPPLRLAISSPQTGRIALVLGAGCSFEEPTGLPLASTLARDAHRRLVEDGILAVGECDNPSDLSSVADAVFRRTGRQTDLVERMNPERFRGAEANEGYLIAAALLREQALGCVLTLNFDWAIGTALAQLGADDSVAIVGGPEDHGRIGAINVIFLHRTAFANFEEWILRSESLETGWQNHWSEVIANRVLASPVTIFAGLGSPARVLLDTTKKIRAAVPQGTAVYQVDPGPPENSAFFAELDISPESYIRLPWCQFMIELSARLLDEHRAHMEGNCARLAADQNLHEEDVTSLCQQLLEVGIVAAGRIRARWLLETTEYFPHRGLEPTWMADLILMLALIERTSGAQVTISEQGVVEFHREERSVGSVLVGHGRGTQRWLAMESKMRQLARRFGTRHPRVQCAIVAGVTGVRPAQIAPPDDIVSTEPPGSILPDVNAFEIVGSEDLRSNQAIINRLIKL